jgi:ribosome recycling factor
LGIFFFFLKKIKKKEKKKRRLYLEDFSKRGNENVDKSTKKTISSVFKSRIKRSVKTKTVSAPTIL